MNVTEMIHAEVGERIAYHASQVEAYVRLLRQLRELPVVGADATSLYPSVSPRSVTFYHVDSEVKKLAAAFVAAGWPIDFEVSVDEGDGDIKAAGRVDGAGGLYLSIYGKPGPSCRVKRVVTGTRVVEDAQYEIECDDEEPVPA